MRATTERTHGGYVPHQRLPRDGSERRSQGKKGASPESLRTHRVSCRDGGDRRPHLPDPHQEHRRQHQKTRNALAPPHRGRRHAQRPDADTVLLPERHPPLLRQHLARADEETDKRIRERPRGAPHARQLHRTAPRRTVERTAQFAMFRQPLPQRDRPQDGRGGTALHPCIARRRHGRAFAILPLLRRHRDESRRQEDLVEAPQYARARNRSHRTAHQTQRSRAPDRRWVGLSRLCKLRHTLAPQEAHQAERGTEIGKDKVKKTQKIGDRVVQRNGVPCRLQAFVLHINRKKNEEIR